MEKFLKLVEELGEEKMVEFNFVKLFFKDILKNKKKLPEDKKIKLEYSIKNNNEVIFDDDIFDYLILSYPLSNFETETVNKGNISTNDDHTTNTSFHIGIDYSLPNSHKDSSNLNNSHNTYHLNHSSIITHGTDTGNDPTSSHSSCGNICGSSCGSSCSGCGA